MMRKIALLIFAVLGGLLTMIGCGDNDAVITGPVGWAIGYRSDNTAAILHTANGGKNWEEQGNPALWTGLSGNDISAVDKWTAWAAVGGGPSSGGAILHTTDGGATWRMDAPAVSGPNDIDDICAPEADMVWAVQNIGGMSGGRIIR
ncbi:MAG: hypothetical protein KKD24_01795, partial [Proteobacteria bacterium]|nr:hypothetical protein [Pseudomonadota bacterium]